MNILLLAGGTSNERDVSLRSGKAIAAALEELNHQYRLADPGAAEFDLGQETDGIDVVFFALHGEGGEDGTLQKQLEELGKSFTGSDSQASALCFNKWQYKQLLQDNGFPVSAGYEVTKEMLDSELFNRPYVLKPFEGGSSLDTQIARTIDAASKHTSNDLLQKYPRMLLEPLVEGAEITVGILGEEPLPVIEIIPPEGLEFDYENKYNGKTQELCPPLHVGEDVQIKAQEMALQIHHLTGCAGMSRTDIMIDSAGNFHILETNTIPGMTEQSLLPKMVKQAGYSFAEFVEKLIQLALSRQL